MLNSEEPDFVWSDVTDAVCHPVSEMAFDAACRTLLAPKVIDPP